MPICTGIVNSLPNDRVQLAALLALFSIALFIESPVIDLLATSTTLARSRQSFAAIRRFSVMMMVWCGLVHLAVAATPLFDFVFTGVLRLPPEVAEAVRVPMLVMVPWSPAIGWRRHVQGLLIRSGVTHVIGVGTFLRVCTIVTVGLIGFFAGSLPGAVVAATALCCSVVVEAVFIHVAGMRALKRDSFSDEDTVLSNKDLANFHLPLTVSTMVMLSSMPLVSRSLTLSPDPILAMNAWQVSTTLAFLLRTMTFALPEVVIANWRPGQAAKLLAKFCIGIGAGLSLLMLLLAAFGLDTLFFTQVTHADADVAAGAHTAFLWCSVLPFLTAATSYLKGVLTSMRVTIARLSATLASVVVLAVALGVGIRLRWPGVVVAAVALTLSQLAEFVVLAALYTSKGRRDTRFHKENSTEQGHFEQ